MSTRRFDSPSRLGCDDLLLLRQEAVARTRTADLNPPLGRPGGPCHVVRRIEQGVGSPNLRDRLVTKVEDGHSLSNPEAAAVYELDLEKTRGLVPRLLVGPHAQYRMDLRGVTVRDLKEAVEELGRAYHAARKDGDARRLVPFESFLKGGMLDYVTSQGLALVLAPEKGGARVVTTFWKGQPDPAPPGQCDPLAERVAYRYARRTIQFDHRRIQQFGAELAERAIDHLLATLPHDSGLEWELGRQSIILSEQLDLTNVRGLAKRITVEVSHRPSPAPLPTAGAVYEVDAGTIHLFLNSRWHAGALAAERGALMTAFGTFLVHEVTHALDVLPAGNYERAEGNPDRYYNQPVEFRAYAKQIVVDVLNRWKMVLRLNPKKSGAALIEAALESSPNYRKVKDHFDRRNQQRLRQVLVRELEQAGLLAV